MVRVRSGWNTIVMVIGSVSILCAAGAGQIPAGDVAAARFRIAGSVVNRSGGALLERARVILRNTKDPKDVQSQLTGDDGRFEFRVPAGKFSLHGAKRGFISSDYNQHEQYSSAIVTGAGIDTESLELQLAPSAVLSGKVLDESGDPVRRAEVGLWREDHTNGISRIAQFQRDVTDDQGAYEFTPLDAGTYFLSVSAKPWYAVHPATTMPEGAAATPAAVDRGLDVVYPTSYYAGATESDEATPIPVRGGDRMEIDLRLAPVPALHIVFRHDPNQGYPFPFLQKRVFDELVSPREPENIQPVGRDVFELTTAPGKYAIRFSSPREISRINEVDISQDHQEVEVSSGEALSNITASIHVLEEETPRELFVMLRDKHQRGVSFGGVNSAREVHFRNVAPGSYEVVAGSQSGSYAVVKIASEARETSGHTLKVPAGASMAVTLTLASGSGRVEGYAKHEGKVAAGAMVVLIPKHPEANLELFRRDQSDMDGSFLLRGVVPGTYTVIAIADGWELDWSRAGVLAKYAVHGQTIVVPGSGNHTIQLPEAVEVQGK
jgi:hypothetical protein